MEGVCPIRVLSLISILSQNRVWPSGKTGDRVALSTAVPGAVPSGAWGGGRGLCPQGGAPVPWGFPACPSS